MQPLSKSGTVLSWNQDDLEKYKSQTPFRPIQAPKITTQKANMRDERQRRHGRRTREDLSRDDLLFLLSILEGELQVGLFVHMLHTHSSCS